MRARFLKETCSRLQPSAQSKTFTFTLELSQNPSRPGALPNRDRVSPFMRLKPCKGTERLVRSGIQIQAQKSPKQVDCVGHFCGLLGGKVYDFGFAAHEYRCQKKINSISSYAVNLIVRNPRKKLPSREGFFRSIRPFQSPTMRCLAHTDPCDVRQCVLICGAYAHIRMHTPCAQSHDLKFGFRLASREECSLQFSTPTCIAPVVGMLDEGFQD